MSTPIPPAPPPNPPDPPGHGRARTRLERVAPWIDLVAKLLTALAAAMALLRGLV